MTPAALVIVSPATGSSSKDGAGGGVVTSAAPMISRLQLILAYSRLPVSGPDWPSRGVDWCCAATAVQASRWAWVSVVHLEATLLRMLRTSNCALVAGCPRWPARG